MRRALVVASVALLPLVTVTACGSRPQTSAEPGVQPAESAAAAADPTAAAPSMMTSHAPAATTTTVEPIAAPPGGLSIAGVFAQRDALAGKPVTVRGKVVKVNNHIMGRNWIHLQDGSGSASDRTNDLTITTDAEVKAGDVITVTGVLATRKDIGAGYTYEALVEHATIVK